MNPSRHSLLALSVVLASALASSGACAQANDDRQYLLKPFLPPLLPLPPNAELNSGSLTAATAPRVPAGPPINASPTEPPRAPGLTITIPATR
jgi:hypothetical protein